MKFEDKNLFSIDPEHISRIRLAGGVLFLTLAVLDFMDPNRASVSSGRLSWIHQVITEVFGLYGYAIFQTLIGVAFIISSRRKSSKT